MRDLVESFDHTVLAWLNGHATPWLHQRAAEVTALGDGYTVTVLIVAAGALLWLAGARVYAGALAAAGLGGGIMTPILKNTFERPRPSLFEVQALFPETSYAYPSGHALLATATLATLAYIIHRLAPRRAFSTVCWALAAIAIVLTGWSRLQLNVHYPSDVLAGFALGAAWAAACVALAERVRLHTGETIHWRGGTIHPLERHDQIRMKRSAFVTLGIALAIGACGMDQSASGQQTAEAAAPVPAPAPCTVVRAAAPLPEEVRETSGLARGATGFWTHNDAGGDPVLYRIGDDGRIAQTVTIAGATLEDWEDIEAAPCADGTCLYVGDIGDNDAERRDVVVYRVREPAADARDARPETLRLTYPDGARDAEALFVIDEVVHVVTKGRREEIALYRAPSDAWSRGSAQLERVRVLFPRPANEDDRVTAATTTPDGRWAAVRTYHAMYLFALPALMSDAGVAPYVYDLSAAGELQGEALVLGDDGTVWTTSEAESRSARPSWMTLNCPLPPAS